MCTVTLIARRNGYALGMNRDESLARVPGLPPRELRVNDRRVLCPSEPGGGTWISLNDAGVTFALINWYSISARGGKNSVSRGKVVQAVSATASIKEAATALARLPLRRINPFRLIAVFPATREVVEWRWNLKTLGRASCPWKAQQWISSGYDEAEAQRIRGAVFRAAQSQKSFSSMEWLRRLHRSHAPGRGPFSTCMHREDAATVSYSEVTVTSRAVVMQHIVAAPCEENHARQTSRPGLEPPGIAG